MNQASERPKIGTAVFIRRGNTFLVYKRYGSHGSNTWSVPGGHLEHGETFENCARREVLEEVGVEVDKVGFVAITNDIFQGEAKHYVTIWFEAELEGRSEPTIKEPHKILEIRWVTMDNLPSPLFEPCWQNLRNARPDLFSTKTSQQR